MEVKTIKRKWAQAYWLFVAGVFLSLLVGILLPKGDKRFCVVPLVLCTAGIVVCILKLRCPYCGKGVPQHPNVSSSLEPEYCSGCGKPFVYDDEV